MAEIHKDNFSKLVDMAIKKPGYKNLEPVVNKELLHYDLLFVLDDTGLLDQLTFQGGTALRLCYGASRLSEDLDFAGGVNFNSSDLSAMKECIEQYVGTRYGLHVTVKPPSNKSREEKYSEINTDHWIIKVETSPERKDLPKQQINIQITNVPAYTREPLSLQHNYDFLPDGYSDTIVLTESLEEIMADKIIAFVDTCKYIRYRDIWDLRWIKQKNVKINPDFILAKINDYKISDFSENLKNKINQLEDIIMGEDFYNQMERFLPIDVLERTLQKEKFKTFLVNEITAILSEVKKAITS